MTGTEDTWGISGPQFLVLFVAVGIVASVIATLVRRRVIAGAPADARRKLTAEQVAYLNGGDRLAIYASLAGLRSGGSVAGAAGGTLRAAGSMPVSSSALDAAIHSAAARGLRTRDLGQDPAVRTALRRIRAGVEETGYAITARQRLIVLLCALLPVAVAVLGAVRLAAGANHDKPVAYLTMLLIGAVLAAIVALVPLRRRPTEAGAVAIARLRWSNKHLAPRMSPSMKTYGGAKAAMGVGLFGAATLYAMDPAFAAEAGIQRNVGAWSSGSSGGSGGTNGDGGPGGVSGGCGGGSGCGG